MRNHIHSWADFGEQVNWTDHLGSARTMSNSDGSTIEWEADYYPFGDPNVLNNYLDNFLQFTDYEYDYELGDNYAKFREQSPVLGRFFSPDPYDGSIDLTNPQSFNRYAYVLDNPLRFFDPLGLACVVTTNDDGSESYHDDNSGGQTCAQAFGDDGGGSTVNGPPPDPVPFDSGATNDPSVNSNSAVVGGGSSGGAVQLALTPLEIVPINCNTILPDGQTVGKYVRAGRAKLGNGLITGAGVDAGLAADGVSGNIGTAVSSLSAMTSIAVDGGLIDFKTTFAGQASRQMLGDAGNFAYYAIGSGLLPTNTLDLGAGAYGLYGAAVGRFPVSFLTGRFFSDDSARRMRGPGLAAGGC